MTAAAGNRHTRSGKRLQQPFGQIGRKERHVRSYCERGRGALIASEPQRGDETTQRPFNFDIVLNGWSLDVSNLPLVADRDGNRLCKSRCISNRSVEQAKSAQHARRFVATDPFAFASSQNDDRDFHVKNSFMAAITRTIANPWSKRWRGRRETPNQVPRRAPAKTDATRIGNSVGSR